MKGFSSCLFPLIIFPMHNKDGGSTQQISSSIDVAVILIWKHIYDEM
jgi:hypothetical protein